MARGAERRRDGSGIFLQFFLIFLNDSGEVVWVKLGKALAALFPAHDVTNMAAQKTVIK